MPATVVGIEYDPNRTCHIALLEYEDGVRSGTSSPRRRLTDGDTVVSSSSNADRAEARQLHAAQAHSRPVSPCTTSSSSRARAASSAAVRRRRGASDEQAKVAGRRSCCRRARSARCRSSAARTIGADRQHRPPERQARQGRPQPLARPQAEGPRRGEETTPATRWAAAKAAPRAAASRRARRAPSPRADARRVSAASGPTPASSVVGRASATVS